MGMVFNNKKYLKDYVSFYNSKEINTAFEYGLGYTDDNLSRDIPVLGFPRTIQEITIPNYYYTNTDWLKEIGYSVFVDSIIGENRTAQVLIDNRLQFDNLNTIDTVYPVRSLIKGLYLLAQIENAQDQNGDFYDAVYADLEELGHVLPMPPSHVINLKFYDVNDKEVPVNSSNLDAGLKSVVKCTYKSEVYYNKEYLISFFTPKTKFDTYRLSRNYIDVYIANYHFRLVPSKDWIYIKASNTPYASYESNRYFMALDISKMKRYDYTNVSGVSVEPTSKDSVASFGYNFHKSKTGATIRWVAEDGGDIIGKKDTLITYCSDSTIGISPTDKFFINSSPNMYNTIGKLTDNIVGILPDRAILDNIGTKNVLLKDFVSPNANDNISTDSRCFPLGTYLLKPERKYFYSQLSGILAGTYYQLSNNFASIYTHSPDGINLIQVLYFSANGSGYPNQIRYGYPVKKSDGGYIYYWTVWTDLNWR